VRGPFHQPAKAAEKFVDVGGHMMIELAWWTGDDLVSSAVLRDGDSAMVAAAVCAESEREREAREAAVNV
jgi:hypothetical protein